MDVSVLKKDIDRYARKNVKEGKRREIAGTRQASLGFSDPVNRDYVRMPAVARAEEAVIGIVLAYPEIYLPLLQGDKPPVTTEDFLTEFNRRVFADLVSSAGALDFERYTPDEVGRITHMKINRMQVTDNGQQVFLDCCKKLKETAEKQQQKTTQLSADDLRKMLAEKRAQPKN